jgi:hypothetical protein
MRIGLSEFWKILVFSTSYYPRTVLCFGVQNVLNEAEFIKLTRNSLSWKMREKNCVRKETTNEPYESMNSVLHLLTARQKSFTECTSYELGVLYIPVKWCTMPRIVRSRYATIDLWFKLLPYQPLHQSNSPVLISFHKLDIILGTQKYPFGNDRLWSQFLLRIRETSFPEGLRNFPHALRANPEPHSSFSHLLIIEVTGKSEKLHSSGVLIFSKYILCYVVVVVVVLGFGTV